MPSRSAAALAALLAALVAALVLAAASGARASPLSPTKKPTKAPTLGRCEVPLKKVNDRDLCRIVVQRGCPLKWWGQGCPTKCQKTRKCLPSQRRFFNDGGCRPPWYCGWRCPEKCNGNVGKCSWDPTQMLCIPIGVRPRPPTPPNPSRPHRVRTFRPTTKPTRKPISPPTFPTRRPTPKPSVFVPPTFPTKKPTTRSG